VAYDEELGDRIRKVFGGEAGVMVRVDPAKADKLLATTTADLVVMRGLPALTRLQITGIPLRSEKSRGTGTRAKM
jgi:hypothetical protein